MSELAAGKRVVDSQGSIEHRIVSLGLDALGGSALTDKNLAVPEDGTEGIPVTYVPARNTVFMVYALAQAEVFDASTICIGVIALDYSGYPDCRPASKKAVEGGTIVLHAPLIEKSKADIIKTGMELGVAYGLTVSCYQADEDGNACGLCDSCRLRKQGFADAQLYDPTR